MTDTNDKASTPTPPTTTTAATTPLELTSSDHAFIEQIAHHVTQKIAPHLSGLFEELHERLDALEAKLPKAARAIAGAVEGAAAAALPHALDAIPGVNALGQLVKKLTCWNCGGAGQIATRMANLVTQCKVCGGAGTLDA